jgi:hypothetical protein
MRALCVVASAGFAVLVWLLSLEPTESKAVLDLDAAWQAVLARNCELGKRAGVDWVFTYGPMGQFDVGVHSAPLFWVQRLAFDLGLKVPLAVAFGLWFLRAPSPWTRAGIVLGAAVLRGGPDGYAFVAIVVLAGLWLQRPLRHDLGWLALVSLLIWVVGLIKFTFFVHGAAAAAAMCLRRGQIRGWSHAVAAVCVVLATLGAAWLLAGQRLGDLPIWIDHSWQVAKGYGEAMSVEVAPAVLTVGVGLLLGVLVLRASYWLGTRATRRAWVWEGLLAATVVIAFKASFTRHGGSSAFYYVVACVPFLPVLDRAQASAVSARVGRAARWLRAALTVAILGAVWHRMQVIHHVSLLHVHAPLARCLTTAAENLRYVSSPRAWRSAVEAVEEHRARAFAPSRTRARVGQGSIDVLTAHQAIAIYGGFHWRPRPVIQSYSAYTPRLLELNRAFFAGPSAPDFVLYEPDNLDDRFPTQEDGPALLEILHRYRAVGSEWNHVLFQRDDSVQGPPPARPLLQAAAMRFGQSMELTRYAQKGLLLELDVRLNALGKLRTLLLQAPWAELRTRASDGSERAWRIVGDLARAGMLVRPFLSQSLTVLQAVAGQPMVEIERIELHVRPQWQRYFEPVIAARLFDASSLIRPPQPEPWWDSLAPYLAGPGLDLRPSGTPSPSRAFGEEFLHLHAPARVLFALDPGQWSLSGRYALDPAVLRHCPDADGVTFKVLLRAGADAQVLFTDHITYGQGAGPGAEGLRPRMLNLPLTLTQAGTVELSIETGPSSACDWALVKDFRVQRIGGVPR